MQLETINSQAIHAIGYDVNQHILEVIFNTGRIYQFLDVPPEEYVRLCNARSKGQYFNARVRDAFAYRTLRVVRQQPQWRIHPAKRSRD